MNIATSQIDQAVDPMAAIRITLGIARLGERDLRGWWSSQGLNPAVSFALAGFRRTGLVIGAELALLSAIRRHHQVLPRQSAVHLFSPYLPFTGWASSYLAELKSGSSSELITELRSLTDLGAATTKLQGWWEELPGEDQEVQSVTSEDLDNPALRSGLLKQLAGASLGLSNLDVPYVDLVS